MTSKICVDNLPASVTDSSLKSNFAEFGSVSSASVMMDRDIGTSKGFRFVEMASAEQARAAINALDGMSVGGRAIVVSLARPREASYNSNSVGGCGADDYSASNKHSDIGYGTGDFGDCRCLAESA